MASIGAPLTMFVFVFRAFVTAGEANLDARLANALCEIGIVGEIFHDQRADVCTIARELNTVNQSLDILAHEAGGRAPFTFQFAFGAYINAFLYNQIPEHRR